MVTMMLNNKYWQNRFDQVEQSANNKATAFTRTIKRQYRIAQKEIEAKIAYWYERLASNNEISVEDAHKLLDRDELQEFKWSLEEYIRYAKKNTISQQFMKELENASAKVHIKKLEALKLESAFQVEKLMGNIENGMNTLLSTVYEDSYYRSMYEISKGFEIGFNISKLDDDVIKRVIGQKWAVDDKNYSDRIWTNKTKLTNTLNNEFSKLVLARGNIKDTYANVANTMNTSYSNAERLVYTEQAFLSSQAQADCFKSLEVDEYMIVATLDDRTCDTCAPLDHNHYPLKDRQVGVNAPPFHPRCRCTTAPYIPDGKYAEATRTSRDERGKTVNIVRADTTYNEWKDQYVTDKKYTSGSDATLSDLVTQYVNIVRAKKKRG